MSQQKESANAREWLLANKYEDIACLIDKVMEGWKRKGTRTRRNWWEVLAGNADGGGKAIEGVTFPVLRAAQIRMGMKVTEVSLCRHENEQPPPVVKQERWSQKGTP